MSSNRLQKFLGGRFRTILSGSPDAPPWLEEVASGDDPGLFLPTDAPWIVHANMATLVGGVRALLMQALHPGTLAGVAQHSRYEKDPLGRLAGTVRWLTLTTFASEGAIGKEAARVNGLHSRVRGSYALSNGEKKDYQASNEDLLMWVHIAFTESFLVAHQKFGNTPIPGGADAYVKGWAKSAIPLGLTTAPLTEAALHKKISEYADNSILTSNESTERVLQFLVKPPLSLTARAVYWILFQAAASSMDKRSREILHLRSLPLAITVPMTKVLLGAMRMAIGKHSPLEEAAIARLKRLGKI